MSVPADPMISFPERFRRKLRALRPGGTATASVRRERSVLAFFATSLLARGSGIVCQLLQVPFVLHYLGKEMFGLWITLASFSYMLSVADFGIGLGAQNRITTSYALDDRRAARRVYLTALCALGTVALGLACLCLPVCLLLDWARLLKLTDPAAMTQARSAAVATLLCCTGGITLSMGQRLAFAVHKSWINNAENIIVNLSSLGCVYLCCRLHLSLSTLILAVYLPSCVANLILNFGLCGYLGWFHRLAASENETVRSAWFDAGELRGIVKTGSLFFVQQLCSLSLFTAPAVLISAILGAAAVVPFNLAQRLFSLLLVIPNGILPPLWPAYAEAKARGDWTWIHRTLNRSFFTVLALTIVPMATVSFFARDLLRLWTRTQESVILPSTTLVGMLFVWNALVVMQQPFGFMLSGLSEVRRVTAYSICTAVTSVAMTFVLGPTFGVLGVVGGLIAGISISLTGSALEARRLLNTTLSIAGNSTTAVAPLPTVAGDL